MLNKYPDVMTVKQLSEALGIGINSAYSLINKHIIGCRRIGKRILIPKICVIDYIESCKYTAKL